MKETGGQTETVSETVRPETDSLKDLDVPEVPESLCEGSSRYRLGVDSVLSNTGVLENSRGPEEEEEEEGQKAV